MKHQSQESLFHLASFLDGLWPQQTSPLLNHEKQDEAHIIPELTRKKRNDMTAAQKM